MNELNDKAYSTLTLLRRASFLMNGLENADDETIKKVCEDIAEYLKPNN